MCFNCLTLWFPGFYKWEIDIFTANLSRYFSFLREATTISSQKTISRFFSSYGKLWNNQKHTGCIAVRTIIACIAAYIMECANSTSSLRLFWLTCLRNKRWECRAVRRRGQSRVDSLPTILGLLEPCFLRISLIISSQKYFSSSCHFSTMEGLPLKRATSIQRGIHSVQSCCYLLLLRRRLYLRSGLETERICENLTEGKKNNIVITTNEMTKQKQLY